MGRDAHGETLVFYQLCDNNGLIDFTHYTDMKPSAALQIHRQQIREISLRHHTTNIRVFGSVVRGEDSEESDLDLLVDPTPETSMMDIGAIRYELKKLLGISVDVLTPKSLPETFRDQVLQEALPV